MTGVQSKVATIMRETELRTRCGGRTMYVSCRFIASGSISVMRYNNNNNNNTAIKKPLIATIEFTTNHHVLLLAKDNTAASSVLKNHRSVIEEAIIATIPAATGLRKDEIWHKVILHGIPTTTTFNTVQSDQPKTPLPLQPQRKKR